MLQSFEMHCGEIRISTPIKKYLSFLLKFGKQDRSIGNKILAAYFEEATFKFAKTKFSRNRKEYLKVKHILPIITYRQSTIINLIKI